MTLAEILAALSQALDLVEGQPAGHAARTARIALRIADTMALEPNLKDSLLFAALLKDSGCSNNSARIHAIFGGDELENKRDVKLVDWSNPLESLKFGLTHTEKGGTVAQKLRRMLSNLGPPQKVMDEVTNARCQRGAMIARRLGFDENTALAVHALDEHWDGKGSPQHLSGEAIPLLGRILCLAQTLEVFATTVNVPEAYDMLQRRSGRWFDPVVVQAALGFADDREFWSEQIRAAEDLTLNLPIPATAQVATPADIDTICAAFAEIIDAKSTFTGEHSTRVMQYSVELCGHFGFDSDRTTIVRRAALLHDIGKLGVSNSILDKAGKLTEEEFEKVKLHPRFTEQILSCIRGFERITEVAAAHHEKLNGRGYFKGLSADQLDLDMRIIAVADVFDALSAARPYRDALPLDEVFAIMDREAGEGLDAGCIEALKSARFGAKIAA